jgi:outer membrane protein assembly factor BamE (lipoprotein component of BamABCDE complex)
MKPWTQPASKIQMGMSETEVMNILGPPSKKETFHLDRDVYDVWFYEVPPSKKKSSPQNVPLTFKNSVLVSTKTSYYEEIREAADKDRVDHYDRGADRMQKDESEQNFNFW